MQYLISLLLIGAGAFMIARSYPLMRSLGKVGWAEHYFGESGTNTMWKLAGVLSIVVAALVLRYPAVFGL